MANSFRFARALSALVVGALLAVPAARAADPVPPDAPEPTIAYGVWIDGLDVTGMTASEAKEALLRERIAPRRERFVASIAGKRFPVYPARLGYAANVDYTIEVAMLYGTARPVPEGGINVRMRHRVSAKRLRAFVAARARKHGIAPRDAQLKVSNRGFSVVKPRIGRALEIRRSEILLRRTIFSLRRPRPVRSLPTRRVAPSSTSAGTGILINRNTFTLKFFNRGKITTFGIAVGAIGHSTPAGRWRVVNKQRNPWWYPPPSPWAAGASPVPPGPNNPLGTRWMGLDAYAIGIHGTPASGSIGSRASHGCIRMRINEAEWLYDRVPIGTPVVII